MFATNLPRGAAGGFYRWHVDSYQMSRVRDVPSDRWAALLPGNNEDPRPIEVLPWGKGGRHIVVAAPTEPYCRFHALKGWTEQTVATLKTLTDRPIIVRQKDAETLQRDLTGAHALVAHGSIAAVEAVILGCPVFVHPDSAAALVGLTDLGQIETPIYPERSPWLNSLAYSQFDEKELCDGTLWRLIE